MKLAFSTLCCPDWDLEKIVAVACEHGINGIDLRGLGAEIDVSKLPAFGDRLDFTLSLLKLHDLQIPCLNSSITLITPATERWQMMLEECRRNAALAEKTHTTFLRIFGGAVPKGMTLDEALLLGRRHLRQLVKISQTFACRVLVETHDDWATGALMLDLLRECDPQEVGVLWDIEHPWRRGETPAQTFAVLGSAVAHVHIKDSIRSAEKSSPKLIGDGDLPVRECITELRAGGYDGWICLETEKRWNSEAPAPEQSIPRFAQFMREL